MTYTAYCEYLALEFFRHLVRKGVGACQKSREVQKDLLETHVGLIGLVGSGW